METPETMLPAVTDKNQQLQGFGEIGMTAAASHAKAMVESRYFMALKNPRDWDEVRQSLMKECRRPSLAKNKSVYYTKPVAGANKVSGLGIRFVEVAFRCMRNIMPESLLVHEDTTKEVHRVMVTDLESNLTYTQDVKVVKTVERSKPSSDGTFLSVRKNTNLKDVFTVEATEDDLTNKRASNISKAFRNLGLRLIPGDLQDEAEAIIIGIRMDNAAKDPDGERRAVIDAFGSIGVRVTDLTTYLGHDIGQCSPAEIVDLRNLYSAVSSGETTWASIMEEKRDVEEGEAPEIGIDEKPAEKKKGGRKKAEAKDEAEPGDKEPKADQIDPGPVDGDGVEMNF